MATYQSPARVPFGLVSDTRLKQLTSKKNTQNALAASISAISNAKAPVSVLSKRKQETFFEDIDTENVDPAAFNNKKTRLTPSKSDFAFKAPKHFVLSTDNTSSIRSAAPSASRPFATPKPFGSKSVLSSTPRTAPAGRSPTRKLNKSKRRSAPFGRINPPSLGTGAAAPFSIDAALSGSVASYTPAKQQFASYERDVSSLQSGNKRPSWYFEIYEETPEEELGNMMEFSTQTLDISDDESLLAKKAELEERGKENIPPEIALGATIVPTPVSRKDKMDDGPRTPLGELETKEFWADGCDDSSVYIVPGDEEETEEQSKVAVNAVIAPAFEDESPTERKSNQDAWADLIARVDDQQKELVAPPAPAVEDVVDDADAFAVEATSRDEAPLFDIWESESAKEEAENVEGEVQAL